MTTIPRRLIPGTNLTGVAVLYRAVDGVWRYRFRDRNVPVSLSRARRIIAGARAVPGATIDPHHQVLADLDAVIATGQNDCALRLLADDADSEPEALPPP